MKTFKNITYILIALLVLSCSEDFLQREDVSTINPGTFYKTPEDAIAATNAAYQPLRRPEMFNFRIWNLDIVAGNSEAGGDPGTASDGKEIKDWANFNLVTENAAVVDLWRGPWVGVLYSNIVLEKVPDITMDETLKSRLLAEAKFLRGLNYFYLVRMFGDVPFTTQPVWGESDDVRPKREPKEKIYNEIIIPDLTHAMEVLPTSYPDTDKGRATKGAAAGMLAKVYLTLGGVENFQKVIELCNVVTGLGYDLNAEYGANFHPANEYSIESIFEVDYTAPTTQDFWGDKNTAAWSGTFTGPRNGEFTPVGFGWSQPTEEFVNSYEVGDKRKDVTVFYEGGPQYEGKDYKAEYAFLTGYNTRKWVVESQYQSIWNNGSPLNFPVLRYADVLLMKAEAMNELGMTAEAQLPSTDANATLNKVRNRAGLPDVTNQSQSQLKETIIHERRMELAFEGHFWFDLVRIDGGEYAVNFWQSLGKTSATTKHLLLPIPLADIQVNPNLLPNNPGY